MGRLNRPRLLYGVSDKNGVAIAGDDFAMNGDAVRRCPFEKKVFLKKLLVGKVERREQRRPYR